MKKIVIYSGIGFVLISCGGTDSRYRDTALLEKPPTLVIQRTPGASNDIDESSIPKKQDPGLGKAVYLTETSPAELRIKKTPDSAWNDLIKAIKLSELKITDQERNKGHVYVEYDSSGFFSKLGSWMKEGRKGPVYLLSVEESGAETKITASMASSTEQSSPSANPDGYNEKPIDASQDLLETLYKTIHDDLVED
ncbi:MAG: outer membrane protein assembly factor BamC [Methylococcaceae bacterium]|nr:outer membrane protein assembly factor BamC [Methylococcaceae bacterium]